MPKNISIFLTSVNRNNNSHLIFIFDHVYNIILTHKINTVLFICKICCLGTCVPIHGRHPKISRCQLKTPKVSRDPRLKAFRPCVQGLNRGVINEPHPTAIKGKDQQSKDSDFSIVILTDDFRGFDWVGRFWDFESGFFVSGWMGCDELTKKFHPCSKKFFWIEKQTFEWYLRWL